ncbi:MAG: phytanoyl-CoA dioxygenase family protein [Pirellulales bacterium]|nr:phytanoyl-CoA dioxygenase family protein [Pirellulales bacterium]
MKLSANQFETYRRQGYLHLPAIVESREIQLILREARDVFCRQLVARGILPTVAARDEQIDASMPELFQRDLGVFISCGKQVQHLNSLHRLALDERLVSLVRQIGVEWPNISTRPVLYFNSPRLAKSEVYWRVFPHQDWRSMQGSLDSVVIWLPLVDLPAELGPLEVVPGSHLDGLVTSEVVSGFGKVDDRYLEEKKFISLPCAVGDVVVFSSFLVHRSGTNSVPAIRWSCHFRYNNLAEPTFVERGYPHPYFYKPTDELLTAGFPHQQQVANVFRRAA